jgi:hypothetical protein
MRYKLRRTTTGRANPLERLRLLVMRKECRRWWKLHVLRHVLPRLHQFLPKCVSALLAELSLWSSNMPTSPWCHE